MKIYENSAVKCFRSPKYNYNFNKETGYFERWGETKDQDPMRAPSPEIADIEIDTACDGIPPIGSDKPIPCKFCYKNNVSSGNHMTLETYKGVLSKFDKNLTQVALGITNLWREHIFPIMRHTRSLGIVPNLTMNGYGLTDELAKEYASLAGAIAVSRYHNPDICYDAVKKLTDIDETEFIYVKKIL